MATGPRAAHASYHIAHKEKASVLSLPHQDHGALAALDSSGSSPDMYPTFLPHVPLCHSDQSTSSGGFAPEGPSSREASGHAHCVENPMHPQCLINSPSPGVRLPLATVVLRRRPAKVLLKESL